jgi:hypothetical protein
LLFLAWGLILGVANGERVVLIDMGREPRLAPISPENLHPSDPVLAGGHDAEGAGTQDNPPVKEMVDGLDQKRLHGLSGEKAVKLFSEIRQKRSAPYQS